MKKKKKINKALIYRKYDIHFINFNFKSNPGTQTSDPQKRCVDSLHEIFGGNERFVITTGADSAELWSLRSLHLVYQSLLDILKS